MTFLRYLLWPFSLLYGAIMLVRNWLYDKGWLTSKRFPIPVVAVGNLTVGGTGKTPHVEYLLRLLNGYSRAVLSRGYKRSSKGFVLANETSTAALLGDEPYQYHRDFPEVTVAVCENRPLGIDNLLQVQPELQAVILDDAMQHRPVTPSLNIMLTDYNRLFFNDLVLPAGLLREPRSGAKRSDVIIVTKCPQQLEEAGMTKIERQIKAYARPEALVFFSGFRYGNSIPMGNAQKVKKSIILLTGIANAQPLLDFLSQHYTVIRHLEYPDHYNYTLQDLARLKDILRKDHKDEVSVITTRKDAAKLADDALSVITHQLPLFYIPIEVYFLKQEEVFNKLVKRHVSSFY
ncbi:tetraacyldisaccharide 4'-kinase [uncultured Pontibacter sp.]|uniref:tetraacyldisaccharide 4'-kinase n=1 Tax=uncultured Pontibacter sp. TaxID=453356 RepID=UPI00261B6119|nr:tetraacyldisaccharide 4'-kinase [uncultured Pontibacter sp.]